MMPYRNGQTLTVTLTSVLSRLGLRTKLFWLVILLIASLSSVLTAMLLHEQRTSMSHDHHLMGATAIKTLAKDSELGLFSENVEFIKPAINALKGERSFLYAMVYRPDFKIIEMATAKDFAQFMPQPIVGRPSLADITKSSEPISREVKINGQHIVEWWAPVYGSSSKPADESMFLDEPVTTPSHEKNHELIGIVRLGLSLQQIEETVGHTLKTAMTILVAFLAVTLIITYIVATTVTRPLAKLLKVSKAVAQGDLDQQVQVRNNDEVGMLATTFNSMIQAIRERDSELRKAHDELEARVQARTAELSSLNQKLNEEIIERTRAELELERRATDLEKSNKELDQFAYVAAHDLKAPLRAIANLATWVEEDLDEHLSGETREHMTLLKGRVIRMENLINGILQYARLGRIGDVEIGKVDTHEVVNQIIGLLDPPKAFVIEVDDGMPVLTCSRTLLEQVFLNLITNAVKYHHRQDGHIQITGRINNGFAEFSVADDGPGIDPKFHEKIFTIFQTLNARDTVESTGVGLAIVKRIVEDQGGHITLDSEEGRGAIFRFTWPVEPLPNNA